MRIRQEQGHKGSPITERFSWQYKKLNCASFNLRSCVTPFPGSSCYEILKRHFCLNPQFSFVIRAPKKSFYSHLCIFLASRCLYTFSYLSYVRMRIFIKHNGIAILYFFFIFYCDQAVKITVYIRDMKQKSPNIQQSKPKQNLLNNIVKILVIL